MTHRNLTSSILMPFQSHTLQQPCVVNTEYEGREGYATSDLMAPHPTKPGFWKIFGREDDRIMHCTGEKVRRKAWVRNDADRRPRQTLHR